MAHVWRRPRLILFVAWQILIGSVAWLVVDVLRSRRVMFAAARVFPLLLAVVAFGRHPNGVPDAVVVTSGTYMVAFPLGRRLCGAVVARRRVFRSSIVRALARSRVCGRCELVGCVVSRRAPCMTAAGRRCVDVLPGRVVVVRSVCGRRARRRSVVVRRKLRRM